MILSDRSIAKYIDSGDIGIDPWEPRNLQPASVDLRLGDAFRVFNKYRRTSIDFAKKIPELTEEFLVDDFITIHPGELMLGHTLERIKVPPFFVARVEGKSSLGRLGLSVHVTAGYIDPGFCGVVTLELVNLNHNPMFLHPGMLIAQIAFEMLDRHPENIYGSPVLGSRYQGATTVEGSKYEPQTSAS